MAPPGLWSKLLPLCLGLFALASPIDDTQKVLSATDAHVQQRKLHGKFLHITDFHPDEFYKVHSSTEEGIACHRKKGLAGTYGAEMTDCDSPMSLINATFDWIGENLKDEIDFVVWTGDTARHDSDERHPRTTPQVMKMNRIVADKFVDTLSSNDGQLHIPVIPTFGNNDFLPHNIFFPGPNKWLRAYADIWGRFIPEEQRHSFQFGGWFWVEAIPNQLAVFSLNTMYFFDRNAGVDGCADPTQPGFQHMEWLRVQLQLMRNRGMKAILIGHVPPARTDSKQNWDESCWQRYTLWLKQYRDVVTGSVYGHMNIDHFLLQDGEDIELNLDTAEVRAQRNFGAGQLGTRETLETGPSIKGKHFSIKGKGDYLQELRKSWSDLPGSAIKILDNDSENADIELTQGSKHKGDRKKKKDKDLKKIGGKYAERYQLTLVSPSVVPNYFPTLRVFEYNITGLEHAPVWADSFDPATAPSFSEPWKSWEWEEDYEDLIMELNMRSKAKRKKEKGRKGRKGKKRPAKPKDPNLVVPEDPSKGSTPGPAYFPQPFTFTGYTQYFANLTHINNDMDDLVARSSKWRDGDHRSKGPKHRPKPRIFNYEVEYSTFEDKIYKLKDLTVMNYLKLAYRIGREKKGKGKGQSVDKWDEDFKEDEENDDTEDTDSEFDDPDSVESAKQGKKGAKGRRKFGKNKVWLNFLSRAFVSTVPEKDLKKM